VNERIRVHRTGRFGAVGGGTVCDLANNQIVIKTVQLWQADGKQFEQAGNVQTAHQSNCRNRQPLRAGTQHFTQVLMRAHTKLMH